MPSTAPLPPNHPLLLGLRRASLIAPKTRSLVAVSGGPDSTALLVALREEGHDIVAAHYDHALQPASDQAAAFVRTLCDELGVQVVVERRQKPLPRGSVQAGARALRYEFLEQARVATGATAVALGHTADDTVEGAVLHLMRGCGLAGLRGMPARRGVFVRPLLNVWRREVLDFLHERGIQALEDPANTNIAYARVRVRREILPALERDRPGITGRFHGAALRAAAMQASIAREAAGTLGDGLLRRSLVATTPEPLAAELMRLLYARAGGPEPSLSRAHLRSMLGLAQPGRGGRGVDLPGGLRLRIVGDIMEIVAGRQGPPVPRRLEVRQCPGCDDAGATHLKPNLDLRLGYRSPGLRMRPAGGRGTRKLQDIFVDARVPREDRDTWPLVFAGDALAVIPGIAVDASFSGRPDKPGVHVMITGNPPAVESRNSRPGDST